MSKEKFDMDLLVAVTSIQSSYSEDKNINKFIENKLSSIDGVTVSKDDFGNIYATKGAGANGYKCIVAHTDTVHQIYENRKVYIFDNLLFSMTKSSYVNSETMINQVGIGGDDKAGVYAAIKAMSDFDNIKSVFFRFEESGCKGSRASDMSFFNDCNFVVQLDRRGKSDFITHTNGIKVASREFEDAMRPIYEKYGFKSTVGVSTDVGALKSNGLKVSACNISSGYYAPHSSLETINMDDLHNSYLMVCEMFEANGDVRFEHKYEPVTYIGSGEGRTWSQTSLFSSSYFSETINAISSKLFSVRTISESPRFRKVYGSKYYAIDDNDIIDIEGVQCKKCKVKDSIVYLTSDHEFMCNGSNHSDWVFDDDLYKQLEIIEGKKVYVIDRRYNLWLKKSDASWNDSLKTYVPA